MKFFHISDLHLGKVLHDVALAEKDQPYWIDQFIKAVDKYNPDAVVIAGDVYDRKDPSPEAMRLFDHLITELAQRGKYVFVIPGNHDSAIRLSHVSKLLESHKIYIAGELEKNLTHVTVPGKTVDVTFWLMPYIVPKLVADKKVLDNSDISSYDEAARELIAAQKLDKDKCNVLVAHQNVLAHGVAPEHSDSETIVGGVGEIDYSAFDAFDYVALGHIHNAQRMGRETVRYSGCPLYYDFSEINRDKKLTMVTINAKDDISVERIEIDLLHKLLQKSGTLDELLAAGSDITNKEDYFVQCILCDKHVPPHAIEKLRNVYGTCLINVKRNIAELLPDSETHSHSSGSTKKSLEEQFGEFYKDLENELLDGDQENLVRKILEQQTSVGGDYHFFSKDIPEADSQELLDLLAAATGKDKK